MLPGAGVYLMVKYALSKRWIFIFKQAMLGMKPSFCAVHSHGGGCHFFILENESTI